MQLTFLGRTYEVFLRPVEASDTSETGTFMGQSYTRKQLEVEQPAQPPEELIFMGQRYVRADQSQPLPVKPRPGEKVINSRLNLQLQRSRGGGRNPAFRTPI